MSNRLTASQKQVLADIHNNRQPSDPSALSALRKRGLVVQLPDGHFRLTSNGQEIHFTEERKKGSTK
jgi:Mn-dependent DtxR family transcriptional regulator